MVWDPTQPTNNTKIRNLGTVITPNWTAIETASSTFIPEAINLLDRAALVPINPPTIATACILFCKPDPTPFPELFVKDPAGNIIQLTEAGNLGSSQTNIIAKNISYSGTSPFAIRWGRYKWGGVTYDLQDGSSEMPATCANAGNSTATAIMTTAMANVNYSVLALVKTPAGGNAHVAHFSVTNATTFTLRFKTGGGGSVSAADVDEFSVLVVGQT